VSERRPIAALRERTLLGMLKRRAEHDDGRACVRTAGGDRTATELQETAARTSGALSAGGVEPGDRVAVMSENRVETLELWLGCAWLGACLVPINTALRGPQLRHVLEASQPRALAVEPQVLPALENCGAPLPRLWALDPTERVEPLPTEGGAIAPADPRPGDPAAVLFTSGTTGPSKGVVCPHAQWYWWAVLTARVLGIRPDDVLYTSLPLFHTNALNTFCQALVTGATFALGPRLSASAFWRRLAESEGTVTYLLGPMVSILLKQPPGGHDRAHAARIALAPATPAELHEPFRTRFGVVLVDAWGSTETNILISNTADEIVPGTMGRLLPEFEARIVDEDDAEVPVGTPGELLVRHREPFSFASGYLGMAEATVEAWRNLWVHTGDRVVRDEDGTFRFVDRLKDAIRRRGENVSSWEVEQVLQTHPDVAAAAVVPVPSELGEDEVMAFVVPGAGCAPEAERLVRFCEPRLAHFAIPRYFEFVQELPLTPSGKVEKFRLRERGVAASTWDREALR
jgi:crotonobetaine/carnitine-CoA ligase